MLMCPILWHICYQMLGWPGLQLPIYQKGQNLHTCQLLLYKLKYNINSLRPANNTQKIKS